jgi:hypothetical protein
VCAGAWASPFDRKVVAKDAAWVVHLDVEAALASTVGRFVFSGRCPEITVAVNEALREVNEQLGIDARKDLKAVTVYGLGEDEDEVVAALTMTAALDEAAAWFEKTDPTFKITRHDGRTEYEWIDDGEERYGAVVASGPDGRVAVVGASRELVDKGADVVEGKAERLSADGERGPGAGAIVWARSIDLGEALSKHAEALSLKNAGGGVVELGEREGEMYAEVTVSAETEADATNIAQVVTGLMAMGRLAASGEEDLAPVMDLIGDLTPTVKGKEVMVRWVCASAKVEGMLESMMREGDDGNEKGAKGNKKKERPEL